MKPLILLGTFLVGAAIAGAGVAYLLTSTPATAADPVAPAAVREASPGRSSEVAELRDRVEQLGAVVGQLQMELAALRASSAREPLPLADEEPPETVAAANPVQIEQQVRAVLEAEERRKEEQAEIERIEREKQMALRQAERIAERLSLAPSDQTLLANHLINANDKRRQVMDQMREGDFDRNAMRSTFQELRDWNNAELMRIFGQDVGAQISEQTSNWGGRGGFGGQAGGRGGRGGGGGG
jgi:hypothetical protein